MQSKTHKEQKTCTHTPNKIYRANPDIFRTNLQVWIILDEYWWTKNRQKSTNPPHSSH